MQGMPPIPRADFCHSCIPKNGIRQVGDEVHFLLKCPQFDSQRTILFKNLNLDKRILKLPDKDLFTYLVNSEDNTIIQLTKLTTAWIVLTRKDLRIPY
jgi:hypothetical protein